jgi:hypothetical protein
MSLINVNIPKVAAPAIAVPVAAKSVISSAIPKISSPSAAVPSLPSIPTPSIPKLAVLLPKVTLPFSGKGLAGILKVGGPTFASVVLPKLQSIVPAFSPGLTIGGGAVGAVGAAKSEASQVQAAAANSQIPSVSVSTTPGVAGVTITQTNTT